MDGFQVGDWVAERSERYWYGPRVGQVVRLTASGRLTVRWQGRWFVDERGLARWAAGGLCSTVTRAAVRALTSEEVDAMEAVSHAD